MATSVCILPILSSENFNNWKFRVLSILEEKQIAMVLDKNEIDFTVEKDKNDFKVRDAKAKSIIVQCLTDKHLDIVKDCKTAKEMVQSLQAIFERKSIFTKLSLKRKLLTLKCGDTEKLEDHFLKFDSITRELENVGCKLDESDKVCHLLLTLNEKYDAVITAIETLNTESSMEFVKARLLDEELKRGNIQLIPMNRTDEVSFKAFPFNCYNCGEKGHKSNECKNKKNAVRGRGIERGRRGYNFRSRSRNRGNNYRRTYEAAGDGDGLSFVALNTESVDISKENSFILDSGASEHLVSEEFECLMTDVYKLNHDVSIQIANGSRMTAEKKGVLNVNCQGKNISIPALIVKDIKHNLLSVSQLIKKGHIVIFNKRCAKIQGKFFEIYCQNSNDLYVLNFKLQDMNAFESKLTKASNEEMLWHRRLGHLNRYDLKILGLPYSKEKCSPCIEGKSTRRTFHQKDKRTREIGELIHSDISGPVDTPTIDGQRYFQVLIDDFSHFLMVKLLKYKNEAEENIIEFIKLIKTQHGKKTKKIRLDNGGEFTSNFFKNFCRFKGIQIQYTSPYTPQQNGASERMNRTLMDRVRTKFAETGLPRKLWGEAIRCSAYELNRCPTSANHGTTPAQIWYNKYDISRLRVFGSRTWMVTVHGRKKLDPKAKPTVMVGYSGGGYRLWDYEVNKIVISTDVIFDENCLNFEDYEETNIDQETCARHMNEDQNDVQEVTNTESEKRTRSGREIKTPQYLNEYELYTAYCMLTSVEDPKTFQEAIKIDEWKNAVNKELKSLEDLQTWTETNLPPEKKAISTRWVFRTKEDGTKKARLVAKGFQVQEEDPLSAMYAPVARMSTIRMFLAHAVQENWPIVQMDVPTAFLNGEVESEIYIKIPEGITARKGKVLKLNRALYGLKESPKCWNNKLNEVVLHNGFIRSLHDFCLYSNEDVWIVVFVDDLLITGRKDKIENVKNMFKREFNAKELDNFSHFLGMKITRNEDHMTITQPHLIQKILEVFNMNECKTTSTPMEAGFQIDSTLPMIDVPYRKLIGSIMYLATSTRPDLMFSVSYLSRVLDKPTAQTWQAAKKILKYLKGTQDKGLYYSRSEYNLESYSDANWGNSEDRKSVSGNIVMYAGNTVSWFSKKQNCVALSTAESEYVAAAASSQELVYFKGILQDFKRTEILPILYVDNLSAISLAKTFENSKRSKHIDIRMHFIKDLVSKKLIEIKYVSSEDNIADMFTKALNKDKFIKFRDLAKIE